MKKAKRIKRIKFTDKQRKEAVEILRDLIKHMPASKKKLIEKYIRNHEELDYFRVTTEYLWATDMPKEFKDPKKLLFQIRY